MNAVAASLRPWFEGYLAAFNRADFAAFGACYADDVIFHGQAAQIVGRDAVLDFRNRTVNRSDREQTAAEAAAPHLTRALLSLSINLPIGVEDGLYSVQFRNSFGQSVVNAVGTAAWDGSAETLVTAVDLRNLAPGEYILAVRQGNSAWREYAVILD